MTLATGLALLLLAPDASYWADALSSPSASVRRTAVRELLELGEEAALELERRSFADPEARRLKRSILHHLRRPTLELDFPPFVGVGDRTLDVELVIRNPSPAPVSVEGIFLVDTGGAARRNPAWRITLGVASAGNQGPFVAPPGGAVSIPLQLALETRRPTSVWLQVVYERLDLRLEASGWVKVGRDRDAFLRACAVSRDPDRREYAVRIIRYQLRKRDKQPGFAAGLRAAALSPHEDVRLGVVRALVEHGRGKHTSLLLHLAADRSERVASEALAGLPRQVDLANAPRELHRLTARCLVSRDAWRRAAIGRMLERMPQRTRHRFLADLLASSRTPEVHAAVAAILGRDGIPLGTDGATGLVPRSQIEKLRRR